MRYLVISDVHGNWEALAAVLETAAAEGYDDVLVLGDLVGYGARPNRVVEWVARTVDSKHIVRGNHDKVVAGIDDGFGFNAVGRAAAAWTTRRLSPENLDYVRRLPQGPREVSPGLVICHGSPFDEDEYLFDLEEAGQVLSLHGAPITLFGHTHIPAFVMADEKRLVARILEGDGLTLPIDSDKRYLINPGSVGQPRDRDPRASYVILDTAASRLLWRRQPYSLERAQREILDADLPEVLAYRLAAGV